MLPESVKFSELTRKMGGIDLSTLESRIAFQKKMYLLESMDIIEPHNFSWYIRGPYSSEVAKIGFDFIEKDDDIDMEFSEDALPKFKELLSDIGMDVKLLELVASIHYLRFRKGLDDNAIERVLRDEKSHLLKKDRLNRAWTIVKTYFDY